MGRRDATLIVILPEIPLRNSVAIFIGVRTPTELCVESIELSEVGDLPNVCQRVGVDVSSAKFNADMNVRTNSWLAPHLFTNAKKT